MAVNGSSRAARACSVEPGLVHLQVPRLRVYERLSQLQEDIIDPPPGEDEPDHAE